MQQSFVFSIAQTINNRPPPPPAPFPPPRGLQGHG
jgi:hypothetical protein